MTQEELEREIKTNSEIYEVEYSHDKLSDAYRNGAYFVLRHMDDVVEKRIYPYRHERDLVFDAWNKMCPVIWHSGEIAPDGPINRLLLAYVKDYNTKRPMIVCWNGEWWYDANTYNDEVKVIQWCELPKED